MLRILNPFIWCWNFFKYTAHLESTKRSKVSIAYDFKQNDTKYF